MHATAAMPSVRLSTQSLLPFAGVALVVAAAALWATVGVAVGLMQSQLPAPTLGLCRTATGALALLALAALRGRMAPLGRVPRGPLAVFAVSAAIFQHSLFSAFHQVGVTVTVAVTVCLPPLIVTLADCLLRRRLPAPFDLGALAVAGLGVAAIVLPGADRSPLASGAAAATGWVHLALASVAFAALAIAARKLCARVDPAYGSGLGLAGCAVILALAAQAGGGLQLAGLAALGPADLGILAYLGLGTTGAAYLAFSCGMTLCRSPASGLVATMAEPALAAGLALVLLHERLPAAQALGCAAVTAAMLLAFAAERQARLART